MIRIIEVAGAVSYADLADAVNAQTREGERVVNVQTSEYMLGSHDHPIKRLAAVVVLEKAEEDS